MDFSLLLTLVQIVSAIWVLVFGSKSVYDLVRSKSRQKGQVGQGLKISPLVIVNIVLAISVLALSTTLLFILPPHTPAQSPYPPSGWKQVINDSMKINNINWPEQTTADGSTCKFVEDGFHVTEVNTKGGAYLNHCMRSNSNFTDLAFETQLTFIKGDQGGIIFRANSGLTEFYYFVINKAGDYGLYIFDYSSNIISEPLSAFSSSTAIHPGLYQPNTIAVVAQGNTFHLYVNGQLLKTVTDTARSFGHGSIGLVANSTKNPAEVVFSNVKVWEPSS